MSIYYDGIVGIGVHLNLYMIKDTTAFTMEEYEEDRHECVSRLGVEWKEAGNAMTGESDFYLVVDGYTLSAINKNWETFTLKLRSHGIDVSYNDLIVISDVYIS